ncbi:1-acyl-sn-glycerol-3-phosphate acyltransferase [Actinomyces sp. 432]|uniref:lysophospholipid acyltransferase family protein n=1 Tax=Actinomyces sp. 432 TaxID=2057798 RepID=UPI0013743D2B|nr:lysophospholipid acyltransferase family protein [Actinomyces sp. 432]QHO90628.1 1-acyl-sn-glycerol-3-phosphate acyltransferase [Actinomyces sp. 432]
MTPFYRFAARGAIIPFLKAVSKQHVTGTENIPREGGFIAVANHLSNLDPLTAMRALVDEDVPIYSLAKSQLFEIPVLGHVFRAGGQIPVYRDSAKAGNSLVEAERRLGEGDPIMIFPEGTLSRDPLQWPMTGKTGAARLAMRTGVPVLPMGQWGAQDVLGAYGSGFRPFPRKDVDVLIGKPFDLSEFGEDTSDHAAVRGATAEIMRCITELVEQLRGEKAPRPFDMKYDGDPGKGNIGVRRPDPPTTSDDVRPSRTGTPAGGPGGNENGDEPETASEQQP